MSHAHEMVPDNPEDGQVWSCAQCGDTFTFVVLDDGYSEWVSS